MADKQKKNDKDQYLKGFVLDLKELNDIGDQITDLRYTNIVEEARQLLLNHFEIAFAKHLVKFRKAYALGEKFAKDVTSESNS